MERHELGKFYATTFDGEVFEFIVFNDNTIDCPDLEVYNIKRMLLKPRPVMFETTGWVHVYNAPAAKLYTDSQLISQYSIDPELFDHMKDRGMIRYSTDMAYLYDFEDKYGYDRSSGYGVASPYKRAKKKGPILVKQKRGQFN